MQRPLVQPNASGAHFGQIRGNSQKFARNSYQFRTNFAETSVFTHLPRHLFVPNFYEFRANFCKFVKKKKASKHAQLHKGHTLQSHGEQIDHAPARVTLGLRHAGAVLPTCHSVVSRTGAMRQRILGSHTPPCHRRMAITTQFSVLFGRGGGGAQRRRLRSGSPAPHRCCHPW